MCRIRNLHVGTWYMVLLSGVNYFFGIVLLLRIRYVGTTVRHGIQISRYLHGKRYSVFPPRYGTIFRLLGIMRYGIWYLAQCFGAQALSKPTIRHTATKPVRAVNDMNGEFHKEATHLALSSDL